MTIRELYSILFPVNTSIHLLFQGFSYMLEKAEIERKEKHINETEKTAHPQKMELLRLGEPNYSRQQWLAYIRITTNTAIPKSFMQSMNRSLPYTRQQKSVQYAWYKETSHSQKPIRRI